MTLWCVDQNWKIIVTQLILRMQIPELPADTWLVLMTIISFLDSSTIYRVGIVRVAKI